jgi:sugar phosphate isomerase/epimerase
LWDFRERIFHVDCKDTKLQLDGRNGALGSHLAWGDPRRGFDFVSVGRGDVPWEACLRLLNAIGYQGPISVEWEDAGMDRNEGAKASLEFLRGLDFTPSDRRFDAVCGDPDR